MKTRALRPGGANLCGRSCGAGGGCSSCVNNPQWRPHVGSILGERECGVGGWWSGCVDGRGWRSVESIGSARSHGGVVGACVGGIDGQRRRWARACTRCPRIRVRGGLEPRPGVGICPSVFVCRSTVSDERLWFVARRQRGCRAVGAAVSGRVGTAFRFSQAFSRCSRSAIWIGIRGMCVVPTTLPPTVSLAGIAAPLMIICAPFVPTSRGRFENWGPSSFISVLRCWPRTHATRRCGLD